MTPQQLKNAILQQAIQGKLVEQRAEEGTGHELYKAIQDEKQKLIQEGKLKKQKAHPEIREDEISFEIPETWKWVRLGDSLDVRDGTHDTPKYVAKGYPLVTSKNLKNGIIDFDNCKYISELDYIKISERSKVDRNDILFAMIGSIGNPVLVLTDTKFSIKNMALFKNISSIIDMRYLLWFLFFSQETMKKKASGGVQSFVSLKFLREFLFPLPPLAEQQRIVEKIEELLPLIERYEKAWTRLEELNKKFPLDMQKAILGQAIKGKLVEQRVEEGTGHELFEAIQEEKKNLIEEGKLKKQKELPDITADENPFEIPDTWKWVRLGEIGDWGSGATPSRTNPEYYGGDIPWLKTGDLTDGYIYDVPEYITGLALERTSVRLNPKGSILIAMYGATIGKLGILTKAMTTNQACCACIVFPSIYNLYLFYFLLANRTTFIKKGEGGAQPNISKEKIVNTLIPLPPLAEQKRIVEKIEELLPLVEKLK